MKASRPRISCGPTRRSSGNQIIPIADRDHADVDAEQGHQPEEAEIDLGVSAALSTAAVTVPPVEVSRKIS